VGVRVGVGVGVGVWVAEAVPVGVAVADGLPDVLDGVAFALCVPVADGLLVLVGEAEPDWLAVPDGVAVAVPLLAAAEPGVGVAVGGFAFVDVFVAGVLADGLFERVRFAAADVSETVGDGLAVVAVGVGVGVGVGVCLGVGVGVGFGDGLGGGAGSQSALQDTSLTDAAVTAAV
jgi:hypothetical protein